MNLINKNRIDFLVIYFLNHCYLIAAVLFCPLTVFSQFTKMDVKKQDVQAETILKETFETYARKEKLCIDGLAIKSTKDNKGQENLITKFELTYSTLDLLKLDWWNNSTGKGSIIKLKNEIFSIDNQGNKTSRNSIVSEILSMIRSTGSEMVVLGILMRRDYPAKSDTYTLQLIKEETINNKTYYLLRRKSINNNEIDTFLNSFDTKIWISKDTKLIYKVKDVYKYNDVTETFTEYYFYNNDCKPE